ncbi:MAG: GNAT family N-acetyltransferase [Pirellulales bacterium]
MSRADTTPAVSHGRPAAKEAARAKRTLDPTLPQTTQRQLTDRRHSPANSNGDSLRTSRSVLPPLEKPLAARAARLGSERPQVGLRSRRRTRAPLEELVSARAGDHPEIYQFLLAVFQAPSREEFHAVQDEPTYDPAQRLLIKREGRIAAHLQLSHRKMWFGGLQLPIAQLQWVGTLPEFRSRGYATRLLHRAEQEMRNSGATLGVLRTRIPQFFRSAGWAVCGRESYSLNRARDILAHLSAASEPRPPLSIRLWRHVELPSLMRIYAQQTVRGYGPLERSEAYWRWLISRKAFDHIIVAIHGRDRMELVDTNAPIVGYAVVCQDRVVELLTSPDHSAAAVQLLARACGDSIERNRQTIAVEAPPGDSLHQLVVEAGGMTNASESNGSEVQMVKVLNPAQFVRAIEPELAERARTANLPPVCELGLFIEGTRQVLTVTRRGVRLSSGRLGRSYLALKDNEFTRMLLGHNDIAESVQQGRIIPSTQIALETAGELFPRLPLWRPKWDDAQA